ncbi:MAG: helix-turn-helix domain-containing protein [Pseudomonadota bacterium]
MTVQNYAGLDCPIAESLGVIGQQWTLLIIRDALMGVSSFSGFEKSLGITKRMLSRRLSEMVEDGLLARVPMSEGSKRLKYVPTQKTKELAMVLSSLIVWGEKWYPGQAGERYKIQTQDTGERVAPGMVTAKTKTPVPMSVCSFLPSAAMTE